MFGAVTLLLLAQTAPPLVEAVPEEETPAESVPAVAEVKHEDPPVSEREDVMTKSAWRLHVSAGGGVFNDGTGFMNPGGWVAIGKPLYVGDRHRRHQWFLDSTVFVGWSPGFGAVLLVLTPTVGTTWYFGDRFGLEWRGGAGFGATPSARNTGVGIGVSVEGSLVFRPFADDRQRLKVTAREVAMANLLNGTGTVTSLGLSVGYEMQL